MREKLIELITKARAPLISRPLAEKEADFLLENGVIVPPCKVGDKLYNKHSLIDEYCYWEVEKIEIYKDENGIVDDSNNWYSFEDIGKTVFLTKEEAENALKESVIE